MMKEVAPQTADGSYSRPSYDFQARIGDPNFPVSLLANSDVHLSLLPKHESWRTAGLDASGQQAVGQQPFGHWQLN